MCVNGGCVIPVGNDAFAGAFRRAMQKWELFEAQLAEQERAKKARKLQPKHRAFLCGRTAMLRPTIDMGS
jgi:hypothetical protein